MPNIENQKSLPRPADPTFSSGCLFYPLLFATMDFVMPWEKRHLRPHAHPSLLMDLVLAGLNGLAVALLIRLYVAVARRSWERRKAV